MKAFAFSALWLLPTAIFATDTNEGQCTLDCQNNSVCTFGMADFSLHPTPNGEPLAIHADTEDGGMHCSCPHGWTGLLCNRKYESCDGQHACYHGGRCIPGLQDYFGNEQLFCDCAGATDEFGNNYVGKYCEHSPVTACDMTNTFCVNEGTCNDNYPADGRPCNCDEAHEGPHCEFKLGNVPDCSLNCQNGGTCVLGINTPNQVHDLAHLFDDAQDFMHCECKEGYGGNLCHVTKVACGEHNCYNGGSCLERMEDGVTKHHCDCSTATGNDFLYAGRFCQYQSTTTCTPKEGETGELFCVNNGSCPTNIADGCVCPEGFNGNSCEFKLLETSTGNTGGNTGDNSGGNSGGNMGGDNGDNMNESCTLDCQNGSDCVMGSSTNIYHDLEHLFDGEQSQRCDCSEEFGGRLCDVPKAPCGEHYCYHGGTCLERMEDGVTKHHCDCNTATLDDFLYAGRFCQYRSNAVCTPKESENGELFCVNGGTCQESVHEGCKCPEGFYGHSCEFKHIAATSDGTDTGTGGTTDGSTGENTGGSSGGNNVGDTGSGSVTGIPDYARCTLMCEHGGKCRKGVKQLGIVAQVGQNIASLNQTHNEDYEHCVCPDGYLGLRCEHEVLICPRGQHVCLHGSQCVSNGQEDVCDCADAATSSANHYAGISCEHQATQICTTGELGIAKPRSFCVNEGTCKARVTSSQEHPGCDCPGGFTGPHCELSTQSSQLPPSPPRQNPVESEPPAPSSGGGDAGTKAILGISIVALIASAVIAVSTFVRNKRDVRLKDHAMATSAIMTMPRNEETQRLAQTPSISVSSREEVNLAVGESELYLGPPRDEDGNALHNVDII